MDLRFYLGSLDNPIKLQTNASITETLDETFDSGVITLEFNSNKKAIAPMTKFIIKDLDTNTSLNFVVINDSVSVVSKKPPLYQHDLTITQNLEKYRNYIIRNSVFDNTIKATKQYGTLIQSFTTEWVPADSYGGNRFSTNSHDIYDTTNKKLYYSNTFKIENNINVTSITLKTESFSNFYNFVGWVNSHHNYIKDTSANPGYYSYKESSLTKLNLRLHKGIITVSGFLSQYSYPIEITSDGEITITNSTAISNLFGNRNENTRYLLLQDSDLYPTFSNDGFDPDIVNYASAGMPDVLCPILNTVSVKLYINERPYNYTLYEVIQTLLNQAKKNYNELDSNTDLFTLPLSGDDYETLVNTKAPFFSFTQKDLYSCVAEVLNYIDAIPVIDINGVLGIEYFNNYGNPHRNNLILSDYTSNLNERYYTNRLISEYQKGRQEEPVFAPYQNSRKFLTGNKYGIMDRDSFTIKTEHKIDYIDNLKIKIPSQTITLQQLMVYNGEYSSKYSIDISNNNLIDLTPAVFEEREYALLYYGDGQREFPNKNNTIYYSQGTNEIPIGPAIDRDGLRLNRYTIQYAIIYSLNIQYGMCYLNHFDDYNTVSGIATAYQTDPLTISLFSFEFYITYHGIFDGKTAVEGYDKKFNGETAIGQTNGAVQLDRMGVNMFGLVSKLGNESRVVDLPITSFDNRIKKGDIWIDNNERYIVNKVKTTFLTKTNNVIQEIEFVKNYNELSLYTKVDNPKRFYAIDNQIVQKGYEIITEFIYFSRKTQSEIETELGYPLNSLNTRSALGFLGFRSIVAGCFENTDIFTFDYAAIRTYNKATDNIPVNLKNVNNVNAVYDYNFCVVPFHCYGSGNMVCFEIGFDNSVNAGDRINYSDTRFFSSIQLVCSPTLYTEQNGNAEMFDIYFLHNEKNGYSDRYYPLVKDEKVFGDDYTLARLYSFKYYKKPNEIFHLNYELALLPYNQEEIFFGETFVNKNGALIKNSKINELYFYYSTSEENDYSIVDKKAHGSTFLECNVNVQRLTGDVYSINVSPKNSGDIGSLTYRNWCIADSSGNIILSCNTNETITTSDNEWLKLTTFYSRKRI